MPKPDTGFLKYSQAPRKQRQNIRYHHTPICCGGINGEEKSLRQPNLMIADHISTLIDKKAEILGQTSRISEQIRSGYRVSYDPKATEAFLKLSKTEAFWLDSTSPHIDRQLKQVTHMQKLVLDKIKFTLFCQFYQTNHRFQKSILQLPTLRVFRQLQKKIGRLRGLKRS
jgi:hypothetical protein